MNINDFSKSDQTSRLLPGEKNKHLKEIDVLERSFSQKSFEIAHILRQNLESELVILTMLRAQIVPKCKHLKKDQDRTKNGIPYCMNCNMDL